MTSVTMCAKHYALKEDQLDIPSNGYSHRLNQLRTEIPLSENLVILAIREGLCTASHDGRSDSGCFAKHIGVRPV
jgi:hypothetical protein